MKSSNLVLMTVAIVAIGILAMPSTISLFSGQHYWYNISGSRLPCIKCHADVYAEYLMTGVHGTLSNGANSWTPGDKPNDACYACHRIYEKRGNITYGNGSGTGSIPGKEAHAASTVACMACHEFDNVGSYPAAGGFEDPYNNASGLGITDNIDADPVTGFKFKYNKSGYPGGHAAHQGFIEGAITNTLMEDSNEACIGCHTGIPVQINWTHAMNLVLNATLCNKNLSTAPTHFNTSNYNANGTVIVISYGNWSGGAKNDSWPSGDIDIWGKNTAP